MVRRCADVAVWLVVLFAVASGASLQAQEAVLSDFYGTGVHQYFSGNYSQANGYLGAAIRGGSKDPRPYYFQALVDMRLGRSADAQANLQKAAALESADVNQMYPVGKSLERIQGPARMQIERYRTLARAEAYQRQLRSDAARYEERRRAQTEMLRTPAAPAPAGAAPPVPPPAVEAEDPFAETPDAPVAEPPAAMPPDEAPATKEGEDPFAAPADEPAEMTDDTPAAADENPLGAEESTEEK
jgi:hypothetical protein